MTNYPHWWFYSKLIEGSLLPAINGGLGLNGPEDIKEYRIGWNSGGPMGMGNEGLLEGGYGNSNVIIFKHSWLDASVESWVVGEELKGVIVGLSDKSESVLVRGDMTLTEIISTPEPTTMLLLGCGLIGLAGYGRRKFLKK